MPLMEPKVRDVPDPAARGRFLEIRTGYVDSGAAPGKDTSWKDPAQLKPQTTTKEEVAARKTEAAVVDDPARQRRREQAEDGSAQARGRDAALRQPAPAAAPAKPQR